MPLWLAKRSCTLREFARWVEYFKLEPWGEERADLRAGIIAATIANVNRGGGKAATPQDFMPDFDPRPKVQSLEEQEAVMARAFANMREAQKRGNPDS